MKKDKLLSNFHINKIARDLEQIKKDVQDLEQIKNLNMISVKKLSINLCLDRINSNLNSINRKSK